MTATVLTATGITFLVDRLDDTATATNFWIAWGTGGSSTGGTATSADTGLKAAATEAWAAAALSQPAVDTNQFVATITAGTGKTIEEAILFAGTTTSTSVAGRRWRPATPSNTRSVSRRPPDGCAFQRTAP
jgi:hypothetical protein